MKTRITPKKKKRIDYFCLILFQLGGRGEGVEEKMQRLTPSMRDIFFYASNFDPVVHSLDLDGWLALFIL